MLEDILRKGLLAALETYGVYEEDVDIELEKPRDRSHGDLSTNLALMLGRRLDRKPRELAGEIAAAVDFPKTVIESVEIAGPGFINCRIARPYQVELLMDVWRPEGALEDIKIGGGKRIDRVEDVLALGDKVEVVVREIDDRGKVSLDLANAPEAPEDGDSKPSGVEGRDDRNENRGGRGGDRDHDLGGRDDGRRGDQRAAERDGWRS